MTIRANIAKNESRKKESSIMADPYDLGLNARSKPIKEIVNCSTKTCACSSMCSNPCHTQTCACK